MVKPKNQLRGYIAATTISAAAIALATVTVGGADKPVATDLTSTGATAQSYIVQAASSFEAISIVQAAGGTTGYELESIRGPRQRSLPKHSPF